MFLKDCTHIEKNVIRHINENLSDICSSDECDEEEIEVIRLMIFERTIWKICFLKGTILKESNKK